ncbi:amidohydrolase family protein [Novosphingobium sp. H3SJ31-1]|uniref:Amidohydrolase family protein n=1 Tax=Novosphingobium album (ex Liu et al. 2023) TaxID=3031130 RepID=A0ABT5WUC9_9SPHN|nr:amidohydrolase family protein [Novosphingobium album (ex Liu et al. 2023)]MDE8653467.1 amidohydrolase family protein [Novosphingobium album (ex Liu et al. 2023)]
MLIHDAEVFGHGRADVRIEGHAIAAIGHLAARPGERVIAARGHALLPGLHDHHIHLAALAAREASVPCGPPEVTDAPALAARLRRPGTGWIRGIGFHESVLGGLPDADELDRFVADRPLRIQHRSGRMWLLNHAALADLLARADPPEGLERVGARFTGRLFDEDVWLQRALGSLPPDLGAVSAALARRGVTGVTDMSPRNDPAIAAHVAAQIAGGSLAQHCTLAGALSLAEAAPGAWHIGPAKLHLHEAALPAFDDATAFVVQAHRQGRAVAVHCVSEVELVFALAAFEGAGAMPGDRIEHASVASPELVGRIAALGLRVCVQPHFVAERGDRYLADVEARHHGDLYRLRSLAEAGVALVGGSDAPFGSADPWAAMAAAVSRTTAGGAVIGADEALAPDAALALYLADPEDLTRHRGIAVGGPADLCLLDRPWRRACERLAAVDVSATFVSGRLVHDGVDQAPV